MMGEAYDVDTIRGCCCCLGCEREVGGGRGRGRDEEGRVVGLAMPEDATRRRNETIEA